MSATPPYRHLESSPQTFYKVVRRQLPHDTDVFATETEAIQFRMKIAKDGIQSDVSIVTYHY